MKHAYAQHTALIFLVLTTTGTAVAAPNPLGFYVGGAVGQGKLEASVPTFSTSTFKDNHTAYKLMFGLRPISLLGAELSYVDLGHIYGTLNYGPADLKIKGATAFGILYFPVPVIDLYVKAGVSNLRSDFNGAAFLPALCQINVPNCNIVHQNQTDNGFAAGAGLQVKFGSLAARAEYERFSAAGAHPEMISLGLIWKF